MADIPRIVVKDPSASAAIVASANVPTGPSIPTKKWMSDLVCKWNSQTYSMYLLSGNIFDIFPVKNNGGINYTSLKDFLAQGIFKQRDCMLYYDIGDGLTFGNAVMQANFYKWLEDYDQTEGTNFRNTMPKEFIKLIPILKRYFMKMGADKKGITFMIDFAEKIVPSADGTGISNDERMAVVSLLKWGISPEIRTSDIGIFLITESVSELQADLVRNPHFAQINIDLPDREDRAFFIKSGWLEKQISGRSLDTISDLTAEELADRTSGLNLVRMQHFFAEAIHSDTRITTEYVAQSKKRLIEEFCQGLVKFIEPNKKLSLDSVATHTAAKEKFKELAWLIKNNKKDVLERGVLLPGRVGVGKSFLVYCFASSCGLPVLEIGDFRSKWVGDTEKQQSRILMVIKALGPVIIVVDEADAVFGNRSSDGDSGVSTRVFAAFAAHIGDSSLRGRELWIAMTSRPDCMAIDMKRQGRFGLCIPLFPAKNVEELKEMFVIVAKTYGLTMTPEILEVVSSALGNMQLTGSEVEAIVVRSKERAVLALRDGNVTPKDFEDAINSFIDPLDPNLLELQELAAVLACSDKRYLPPFYVNTPRSELYNKYQMLKALNS